MRKRYVFDDDDLVEGRAPKNYTPDDVVARGDGEITLHAVVTPPQHQTKQFFEKERKLKEVLRHPRDLGNILHKAVNRYRIEYEIFNINTFKTRRFDSTQIDKLSTISPALTRAYPGINNSLSLDRSMGVEMINNNNSGREVVFRHNSIDRIFEHELFRLYPEDYPLKVQYTREAEEIKQQKEKEEEINRKLEKKKQELLRIVNIQEKEPHRNLNKNWKVNMHKFLRKRINDSEKRKQMARFSNSCSDLQDSKESIDSAIKKIIVGKDEVAIKDCKNVFPQLELNPFDIEHKLSQRDSQDNDEFINTAYLQSIQKQYFANILSGNRENNEKFKMKQIAKKGSGHDLHTLTPEEIMGAILARSKKILAEGESSDTERLIAQGRESISRSLNTISEVRKSFKKIQLMNQPVNNAKRAVLSHLLGPLEAANKSRRESFLGEDNVVKDNQRDMTKVIGPAPSHTDANNSEEANSTYSLLDHIERKGSLQDRFGIQPSIRSWMTEVKAASNLNELIPSQKNNSSMPTVPELKLPIKRSKLEVLTDRCNTLTNQRYRFRKVKADQIANFERKMLALEQDRISKNCLQKNILSQLAKNSNVRKVDAGASQIRKGTAVAQAAYLNRPEYKLHLGFYSKLLAQYESNLQLIQAKLIIPFKDILDYHRLILLEGACLGQKDAENALSYLKTLQALRFKSTEKTLLGILTKFYCESGIVEKGFFDSLGLEEITK